MELDEVKKLLMGLLGIGFVMMLAGCGNHALATINGEPISQDALYDKMKDSQEGQQAFQELVVDKGLEHQYGNQVPSYKVNKKYHDYKKEYGTSFKDFLTQNVLTTSELKNRIKEELLMRAAIRDNTNFSSSKLKKQFKNYQPKVTVDQILTPNKRTAEKAIRQLTAGKSFANLAKQYSIDSTTKNNGGRLAAFNNDNNNLDPKFKAAAFQLKTGQFTKNPVKTQYGY